MNRAYTVSLDSIWTPVAKYLANLPERYDQGEAYGHHTEARKASVDLLVKAAPVVRSLLTDEQRRKLPAIVASYLDTRYLAGIRSGTAGSAAAGAFGGGFIGAAVALSSSAAAAEAAATWSSSATSTQPHSLTHSRTHASPQMRTLTSSLVIATLLASTANAQQSRPPLRHLGAAVATSDASVPSRPFRRCRAPSYSSTIRHGGSSCCSIRR